MAKKRTTLPKDFKEILERNDLDELKDKDEDQEAVALARSIGADSDEATLDRLCQLAVKWVLANPLPIQLDKVNYTR